VRSPLRRAEGMLPRFRRRTACRLLAAGFLTGVSCWFFGLDAWRAILSGCSVTAAGLVLSLRSVVPEPRHLAWTPGAPARQRGSRSDVANLSRSLHSGWGYVDLDAQERLQSLVRRRLLLDDGLDLDRADQRSAIERRIGAKSYRLLTQRQDGVPTLRGLISCLDALEATDSAHYSPPRPRLRDELPTILFSLRRKHARR
jgi:hypothetical protein